MRSLSKMRPVLVGMKESGFFAEPTDPESARAVFKEAEGLNRHFRQTVFSMRLSYSLVVPFSPFGPSPFLHSSSLQTRRTFFLQPTTTDREAGGG